MIYRYPPEVIELVKEYAPKLRDKELAALVNDRLGTSFTAQSMKSFRGNHRIKNGKGPLTSEEFWRYQTKYPQGMYEYIRDNSWGVSSAEMAQRVKERFGYEMTPTCMKQFRQRNHIKSGETGWFLKGHPPATKGMTLEQICKGDTEKLARIRATQFKKGHTPLNQLPVGAVTVVNGYKLRKKQMTGGQWERWEMLHRAIWEEHNGPIPEDSVVVFKDGDPLNCELENLMLVTRAQHAVMVHKGYRSADPDITETGAALAALEIAVNKKKKERKKRK